eukprot:1789977-Rhodomonas_salina.3
MCIRDSSSSSPLSPDALLWSSSDEGKKDKISLVSPSVLSFLASSWYASPLWYNAAPGTNT